MKRVLTLLLILVGFSTYAQKGYLWTGSSWTLDGSSLTGISGSGGTNQTPLVSDINADSHGITNLNQLQVNGVAGSGLLLVDGLISASTIVAPVWMTPTNSAPSHIVPVGESDFATNAAFSITGISGIVNTNICYAAMTVFGAGSAIAIRAPAGLVYTNGTWFVTNQTDILFRVIPGRATNGWATPIY